MSRYESDASTKDIEKDSHVTDPAINGGAEGYAAWPTTEDEYIQEDVHRTEAHEEDPTFQDRGLRPQLKKTVSARSAVLTRTVSGRSGASSWRDPGPPPDGGLLAWTQSAMVHVSIFSTWGYITSYGTFLTYYTTALNVAPSTITWVGSVQIFLLFFLGTFSGRALDAGLFHYVYIAGTCFQLLGIFATSFATKYWQLFLSQGLCMGIANGLQFTPGMALLSTYFAKNRSFAVGVGNLGSCTGGIVYPVIVQQLLPRIGFPWTVRVIGFVMVITNAITISFFRTRLPPRKAGPIVEWSAFRELPYVLFCAAMFFNFWGIYFAFYYVGLYGRNVIGVSYQDSINLLLTMVAVGFLFRLVPNFIADKIGPLNMIIPFSFWCSALMYGWIGIQSRASLYVFAGLYGCGSAGIQSMFPATLASLTTDLKKAGVRMGMCFSITAFAALTGPPLAGALIQSNHGSYLHAQIWGGTTFLVAGVFMVAARIAKVGWTLKARI